ncbi:FtsQ-type POTRA domain-containing protein [Thiotrichales bacterium 19S9-12]|nr:FtsQ-type POTRA domain-containing protein [Thiotrichales bacterium 19S9-11]MCF6811997.1 FtsQ-type POTRA domain-containing protein [Thiotrichales bacterium 19S9-12]
MRLKVIIKVSVFIIIILGCIWLWHDIHRQGRFPIKNVKIDGTYHYVSPKLLQSILSPKISVGFFNIDVDDLQKKLAKLPGVKSASIRRSWPATISVSLVEYKAVAYWNQNELVTGTGKVFSPKVMHDIVNLPHLYSSNTHSKLMIETYNRLEMIAKKHGESIESIKFIGNQWTVKLNNNDIIKLGSQKPDDSFAKILMVLAEITPDNDSTVSVDMRYQNGFIIDNKKK